MGKLVSGRIRHILVKFSSAKSKAKIYKNVSKLANTNFSVSDHYPPEITERRKSLYPVLKQAKQAGKPAKLIGDKLFIGDRRYIKPGDAVDVNFDSELHASDVVIHHAAPILETGSTFQGHYSHIEHQVQFKSVLLKLFEEKNIAQATHNVWAYRVESATAGQYVENFNDDGEHGGGFVLLKLLRDHNVTGMVITTRWYGGVHLGPKRFDCIRNSAERSLIQSNVIEAEEY